MSEQDGVELTASSTRLTEWKNEPTVRELKQDLREADSTHSSQKQQISDWLDNLNVTGKAEAKTSEGSSKVVPRLIRKQAEWRYSPLSEPFLATDDVFNVKPVTWEDVASARQNQLILNNQFNTRIDKVSFIDDYVRAAVDEGTVIVRVGWEFEEEEYAEMVPQIEHYPDPSLAPMHQHLAQLAAEDPERFGAEVEPAMREAHQMTMQTGQPMGARIVGYQEETRTRTLKNWPTVEVCDYRNIVVDPTCNGDIDKASFVIYSFESSLSALKKDGRYRNLENINISNSSVLGDPDHESKDQGNFTFSDEPRKKFVVHEYWGYWDIDGSGNVQPIVAAWVNDTLIRMEENPFPDRKLPFVFVPYMPIRRSLYGEPDGALLEDNQKIAGAVTRGMIDILGKSANGQTGMRKDMLDMTNKRRFEKGLDYEFNANTDPRQGIFMHTYPEIPASAQYMLQVQNLEAESLTGVKAFSGGMSGDALGTTATGVRGVLDAASKRELAILRRLAKGMVKIGRKMIAMNQAWLSEEEVVRVTNEEFVTVRRDDLGGNFDLRLSISTAEEDNQKAEELAFMLQTMGNNMDPLMSRMILADIARLRKMPDLAKRIEDYQPQPDPLAQRKAELEVAELEAKVAKLQADAGITGVKAESEQAKAAKTQSETDLLNLEYVERESGVTQERELQKHGEQARSQRDLKLLEHEIRERSAVKKSA